MDLWGIMASDVRSFGGNTLEKKEEEKESISISLSFFFSSSNNNYLIGREMKQQKDMKGVGLHVTMEIGSVGLFISCVGRIQIKAKSDIDTY